MGLLVSEMNFYRLWVGGQTFVLNRNEPGLFYQESLFTNNIILNPCQAARSVVIRI